MSLLFAVSLVRKYLRLNDDRRLLVRVVEEKRVVGLIPAPQIKQAL